MLARNLSGLSSKTTVRQKDLSFSFPFFLLAYTSSLLYLLLSLSLVSRKPTGQETLLELEHPHYQPP